MEFSKKRIALRKCVNLEKIIMTKQTSITVAEIKAQLRTEE
jgi:hypothetical protein